ncbi:DUF6098 family protein [Umezawaea beigongshangensis]|uniref:DUF6098 family protein n=1 Tax=Umezawaea beigongshangensis TaxID=2780383 RepID=UPI0018F23F2E|nr:DUF6098 family protein [Umezawaea beigongshangensis]
MPVQPSSTDLPVLQDLDALVLLVASAGPAEALYVRWSLGPLADAGSVSGDSLTGVPLTGLSANSLAVEPWWADRSPRLWLARKLLDYGHLRAVGTHPWVLDGAECGRGPDNEPLVVVRRAIAEIGDDALREAEDLVGRQAAPDWGSLDRGAPPGSLRR